MALACRGMDNMDIDMHPGKDNPENYPDRPDYWADEIELTPEHEDQLIEIYRDRIDHGLIAWDPASPEAAKLRRKKAGLPPREEHSPEPEDQPFSDDPAPAD